MGLHKYLSIIGRSKLPSATIYRKCKEMPLFNYMEYLEDNDLRWFTKEFVYAPDLDKAMLIFYGDMLELTGNHELLGRFTKMYKVMKWRGEYNSVSLLLNAIYNYPPELGKEGLQELIDELGNGIVNKDGVKEPGWNYHIDTKKDIFAQVEKINNRIQGLITKIELAEKDINKEDEGEKVNLQEQIVSVSLIIKLPYRLDPKTTNVAEWIELQKQAKKIIDHERKRDRPGSSKASPRRT